MLKRKWLAGILLVIACGGFVLLMMTTKTGLVPNEDMGTVLSTYVLHPETAYRKPVK